jgi:hypothetical protein
MESLGTSSLKAGARLAVKEETPQEKKREEKKIKHEPQEERQALER